MTSQLEKKVMVGLGMASVMIAAITVVYHVSTERLVESAGRVTEMHALIESLGDFENHYQTARMAMRGYVVTGDKDVLELFEWSKGEAMAALPLVRDAASNEQQKTAIAQVESIAREQLAGCDEVVAQRTKEGKSPTPEALATVYRNAAKDPLREHVKLLQNEAKNQLSERQSLARDNSAAMMWLLAFGAMVEFAFALAAAGVIRRNIRDRGAMVDALKRSEAMLRGFYDSDATMMGVVELIEEEHDVVFVSANNATLRTYPGIRDLTGMKASQITSKKQGMSVFLQKYRQSLRENGPVQFEYDRQTPQGTRSFIVVVCPIKASGLRPRFSFLMLDQTERKQAEESLKRHAEELAHTTAMLEKQSLALVEARQAADEACEAKSNFLANMSHEIRTPMTAVVGYADLLAETGRSDEQRKEWVGVIRRNARHLLEVINDILDLSKIEAGKMAVQSISCDAGQIASDVVAMLQPRAQQKNIALTLDIDGPLPRDMGSDPLRLRQILVNLIGNAIKFTEVGEVAVRISCDPPAPSDVAGSMGTLHIAVRDTGIGITRDQLARLFKPFSQADESTSRRFGGSGLGLAISQRLAKLLGGELTARSEPNMGSTFTFSLPVQSPSSERSHSGEAASPMLYGQTEMVQLHGRILVAEDAPDTQRLLNIVLGGAGAEVIIANDGREAVQAAMAQRFDLILMDMQMPRVDGYAATRELRRSGIKIPIIALTGHAMGGDRERSLAAGCDEYLTKPIDVPALLARVARHLAPVGERAQVA